MHRRCCGRAHFLAARKLVLFGFIVFFFAFPRIHSVEYNFSVEVELEKTVKSLTFFTAIPRHADRKENNDFTFSLMSRIDRLRSLSSDKGPYAWYILPELWPVAS